MVAIIAAIGPGRIIGKGNDLPWHIGEDLRLFKSLTMGGTIIMGRKTFESIGRSLPGRINIVISSTMPDAEKSTAKSYSVYRSLDDALQSASALRPEGNPKEASIFIIGGSMLYAEAIPVADRMYLSKIKRRYPGNVLFPEYNSDEWSLQKETEYNEFTLQIFERRK
jgi:dihydrofolate reductase